MKVVIVDTYYPHFLDAFYRRSGDLAALPYADQHARLLDARFGTSDYYSRHLRALGVEAEEVIANSAPLQLQWASEHGRGLSRLLAGLPSGWIRSPLFARAFGQSGMLVRVLAEQIRHARPDVLYLQDLNLVPPGLLRALKKLVKLVVGQIASPLPPDDYLQEYDLILTSFPHWVARLRDKGIATEYFRLGFDPSVLTRVGTPAKRYACTFVGGISGVHQRGTRFLEEIARNADVDFFGYGADTLPADSPIRARHHGAVWALDMYRTLAESRITLNRHVDVAENHANNMRLFEATGMGTMLLTDAKDNLQELFEPGKEIVAYDSVGDAIEKIEYYSGHAEEREAIARAGQQRTLRDHTYERRMMQLVDILARRLRRHEPVEVEA